jgi:GNAT superfamily N-acetyltransferase
MHQTPFTIQIIQGEKKKFKTLVKLLGGKLVSNNVRLVGAYRFKAVCTLAFDAKGRIVGGLMGTTYWGWLYIHVSWVDRGVRGQGVGGRLIQRMEEIAFKRGCRRAYVGTWSFQAPGYYRKMGYRPFSRLKDFPPGHTIFEFQKELDGKPLGSTLPDVRSAIRTQTVCGPKKRLGEISKYLGRRLGAFIVRKAGARRYATIGLVAKDPSGRIIGGLIGATFYGWVLIDLLWVDEKLRCQGLGRRLLQKTEALAKQRGCLGVQLKTYSFGAPGFFKKMGYKTYGRLADLPKGHERLYLSKRLR